MTLRDSEKIARDRKYLQYLYIRETDTHYKKGNFPSSLQLGGSDAKESPAMWETWVRSLEEGMVTHFSILVLENPHGQRSLGSPWGLLAAGHDRATKHTAHM